MGLVINNEEPFGYLLNKAIANLFNKLGSRKNHLNACKLR